MPEPITKADEGKLFTTDGTDTWECECVCPEPTAYFKNLKTGRIVADATGKLALYGFRRLVQET